MSTFEQIVEYAAQFDAKFPETIEGAEERQIAELESLLGRALPGIYKDFLQVMGRNMDWIAVGELDLRIETVLDYYRRENWLPREKLIRIGTDHEDIRLHPYLDVFGLSEYDPEVISLPPFRRHEFDSVRASSTQPLAGSLPEMIAMPVFKMFELRAGGRIADLLMANKYEREMLKSAEEKILSLGFEKLWFSSKTGHAYRRDSSAIHANQFLGYPLQMFVAAESDAERGKLAGELTKRWRNVKKVA